MIDTHCHIDLYDDPLELARRVEHLRITCVAVTMLPSHYKMGKRHLATLGHVHEAIGLHPLRASEAQSEIDEFLRLAKSCEFIGEVGLDFSRQGRIAKNLQIEMFSMIAQSFSGGKFVSVHSRDAFWETMNILEEKKIRPVCFHYFTGGVAAAKKIAESGHFFSFNQRMLKGRHRNLVKELPHERILVESDGPFLTSSPINAVRVVYEQIADIWEMDISRVEALISSNFSNCRTC